MYRCFSYLGIGHRRGSSPLISLLASKTSLPSFGAAKPSHRTPQNDGHLNLMRGLFQSLETAGLVRGFSSTSWGLGRRNQTENANVNANASAHQDFMRVRENINSRSESNASAHADFMRVRENINSRSENNAEVGGNFRHMDFVRGVIEEDEKGFTGGSLYPQYHYEHDADFVHIKMLRNNTFVTVTDPKGNIKLSGSAGSLKDMKSGQKLSRYAAEATAEVVGRRARGLGLKSVVMKVKGFTHFRRKRQAILSWREGFTDSRGDKNPIVYIEDTTRRPHNGCRLPKKRRI